MSIARQISAGIEYCRVIGASLDPERHIFIDRNRSGRTMAGRSALHALLAAARAGLFDSLVVQGLERLTRNVADAAVMHAELESLGITIHVVTRGSISGSEMILSSFQHQKELDALVERINDGRRRAARSGSMIGSRPKYGYDRVPDDRGFVVNTEQALIVRRCFERIDGGMTRRQLVKALKAEGVVALRGRPWAISQLHRRNGYGLLQDPVYKGTWTWARGTNDPITIETPHLAIVDAELFDRVQEKLSRSAALPWGKGRGVGLLTGKVRCSCGMPMTRSGSWIICSKEPHWDPCTEGTGIPKDEAERQYYRVLLDEVLEPSRFSHWDSVRTKCLEKMNLEATAECSLLQMRLDQIGSDLDSFGDEFHDDPIASAIVGPLEAEFHDLWEKREKLRSLTGLRLEETEAKALRTLISGMIVKVPYRTTDPQEIAAVSRMHELVPRMVVERRNGQIELRFLLGVLGAGLKEDMPQPDSVRWIGRPCPQPPRGIIRRPEAVLQHHRDAAAGRYAFTEREWSAVAHLFEPMGRLKGGHRLYAEALIFVARTGMPINMLPERYAGRVLQMGPIRKFGFWPRMLAALDALGSDLVRDIDRNRFAARRSA
ncbi:hypothetical protein Y590_07865 [Methylobacterium sp. AMS5]|nr:hypothetical protein Y590_07865 [Methylobacterium sp. AMS5]